MKKRSASTARAVFSSVGLERVIRKLGLVSNETLATLKRASSPRKILGTLAHEGLIDEHDALQQIATHLNIQFVRLFSSEPFTPQTLAIEFSWDIATLIDFDFASKYRVIPLGWSKGKIVLGVVDPLDLPMLELVEKRLGQELEVVLCAEDEITAAAALLLKESTHNTLDKTDDINLLSKIADSKIKSGEEEHQAYIQVVTDKIINFLLADAVAHGAKRLQITSNRQSTTVKRESNDGGDVTIAKFTKRVGTTIVAHLKQRTGGSTSHTFYFQAEQKKWHIGLEERIADNSSEIIVKIKPGGFSLIDFSELGMRDEVQHSLKKSLENAKRVVLIAGPKGALKTTTLYSTMRYLARGAFPVFAVEDHPKVAIDGITQHQTKGDSNQLKKHVKSATKADRAVIIVNRPRKADELKLLFDAGGDDHLVIATVDAATPAELFRQLIDAGVTPTQLQSRLEAVLFQISFKNICEYCARPLSLEELEIATTLLNGEDFFEEHVENLDQFRVGTGCAACQFTEHSGSSTVFSFLKFSGDAKKILASSDVEKIADVFEQSAHPSFRETAIELLTTGAISTREYKRLLLPVSQKEETVPPKVDDAAPEQSPVVEVVAETQQTSPAPTPSSNSNAIHKKRVLVVDDDADVREIVKLILESEFYEVVEATDGHEGLERVFEAPPDLVLCDLAMPRLNGKDFVRRVRSDDRLTQLPIIMFTAFSNEDNEVELINCGADDFLPKTSSPAKIVARVRRLINRV